MLETKLDEVLGYLQNYSLTSWKTETEQIKKIVPGHLKALRNFFATS